jgi:hypothetical protein
MAKRIQIVFGFLIGQLICPVFAAGQSLGEKTGPQIVFINPNARASALGEATSAVIDDASGVALNPSILGFVDASFVSYSFMRVYSGVSFQDILLAINTGREDAISMHLGLLHYGGIAFVGDPEVRSRGFELKGAFAYGRKIFDGLSIGASLGFLNSTTDPEDVWAFDGQIGIAYAPMKLVRYAVTLRGLSSDYDVSNPILGTDVQSSSVPKILTMGLMFDYTFAQKSQRLVVVMENEKLLSEPLILYKFGFEYSLSRFISARLGGRVRGSEFEPRSGLGVDISPFRIDYGYLYSRRDERPSHTVTLSFTQ